MKRPATFVQKKNPLINRAVKDIITIVIPIVIAVLLTRVLLLCSVVQSGSMEPTIMTKDIVVGNPMAYKTKTPERGDIVYVQNKMTNNELYVKRIIGMPGENVSFKDGHVYINGQRLDEAYIDEEIETNSDQSYDVPKGCYFVLGDNREISEDSRYWNDPFVRLEDIKGKIILNFPSLL